MTQTSDCGGADAALRAAPPAAVRVTDSARTVSPEDFPFRASRLVWPYLRIYCGRATSTGNFAVAGLMRRRTSLVHNFSVSRVRKPFSKSQTAQKR